jgi:hypothetical protein
MIKIENYESDSSISMKVFIVSLATNDKKRCKAENVVVEDSGALSGIVYDCNTTDDEGPMGQDTIWSFAPGTWIYVERDFAAENQPESEPEREC